VLNEARVTLLVLQPLRVIGGVATCQSPTVRKVQQHQGPSCFAPFFLIPFQQWFSLHLPLVVSYEATQALCFLFRHGNSVESESLELELESAKTFARHMLLGE